MNKACSLVLVLLIGHLSAFSQAPASVKDPVFKKDTLDIKKFGAVADGLALNTKAINDAIKQCSKNGGGVVLVPAGIWNTGPVVLEDNVNLHLAANALLQFTDDFDQYPLVEGNWEGLPQMRNQSPLSASGAKNIAITGRGIIDGNGDAWRMVKKDKLSEGEWQRLLASGGRLSADKKIWYPTEKSFKGSLESNPGVIAPQKTREYYNSVKDYLRPNLLVFNECSDILLEGVTFQNSPAWCLHPLMSKNLVLRNIYVKNPWYAQNGDGVDLESCSNVLIEGCTFDVGDDGICIKSGRDEAGRKRGMPTENVVVKNCTVYHAHGGFVIGSEMSGGAKNIYVENCTFIGTDIGLRFKTTRGRGGVVENIYVKDISMKDIVGDAILFDMYYAAKDPVPLPGETRAEPVVQTYPVTEATPQFKNFYITNVYCNGADKAIFIRGLPEMNIRNIVLENMVLQAEQGIDCQEATNIVINNVQLITRKKEPLVSILNSSNITFNKLEYSQANVLLNVKGSRTANIKVENTDTSKASSKIVAQNGAAQSAVEFK